MDRLILDTGVLISAARGQLDLSAITDESDPAVPAIVVAEFLVGARLDDNPARAAGKEDFLNAVLSVVPIEDYTADVADHHADLLAHARRTGRKGGPHDLIIAATARATKRILVTTDARAEFDTLPLVQARVLKD
ncbi:MAG: PIN domain-containing protein [Haloechinothrix sp.]